MELKDGDRYMDIGVEQAVITPLHPDTLHNFGPASSRDTVVYTCERPGGETSTGDKLKTIEKVREWKDFMSHPDRNIKHVIILLGDDELEDYEDPGLIEAYKAVGVTAHHIPYTSENSFSKIMAVLDEVAGKGERVVAHCTHGMGRSGRIAAGWLVHKYGLTAEEASEEVLATARANGVERMGAPTQLTLWMEKK
ncbi:dual specificity phosphatase [Nitzschia inconspicua]|uniref:Dual specificity phosphatase n=1 Tax=Nitzschia inconspicua TaxID=303405 RepID=A0A9K3PCR8_9STRA|nr:dual specificity phosphatase [Nitzschia inconspicua]KAG7342778.1 dual specificity phosphatase [Nitzschia inconspicua]